MENIRFTSVDSRWWLKPAPNGQNIWQSHSWHCFIRASQFPNWCRILYIHSMIGKHVANWRLGTRKTFSEGDKIFHEYELWPFQIKPGIPLTHNLTHIFFDNQHKRNFHKIQVLYQCTLESDPHAPLATRNLCLMATYYGTCIRTLQRAEIFLQPMLGPGESVNLSGKGLPGGE